MKYSRKHIPNKYIVCPKIWNQKQYVMYAIFRLYFKDFIRRLNFLFHKKRLYINFTMTSEVITYTWRQNFYLTSLTSEISIWRHWIKINSVISLLSHRDLFLPYVSLLRVAPCRPASANHRKKWLLLSFPLPPRRWKNRREHGSRYSQCREDCIIQSGTEIHHNRSDVDTSVDLISTRVHPFF